MQVSEETMIERLGTVQAFIDTAPGDHPDLPGAEMTVAIWTKALRFHYPSSAYFSTRQGAEAPLVLPDGVTALRAGVGERPVARIPAYGVFDMGATLPPADEAGLYAAQPARMPRASFPVADIPCLAENDILAVDSMPCGADNIAYYEARHQNQRVKVNHRVPTDAKVGICIATHGSVPYVHLGLRALKQHNLGAKVLVHDDDSNDRTSLHSLADKYDADFVSTQSRRQPTIGDTSAFAEALRWGERLGLDIVIKCSRRFILNKPFVAGLVELMHNTGYATACAPCAHFSFGFRSELVAMAVKPWIESGVILALEQAVRENREHVLAEAWLHDRARDVHRYVHPKTEETMNDKHEDVDYLVRSESMYPRAESYDGYAWWPLMGLSRVSVVPGLLWHDSHVQADYAKLAQYYRLPYTEDDFVHIPGE